MPSSSPPDGFLSCLTGAPPAQWRTVTPQGAAAITGKSRVWRKAPPGRVERRTPAGCAPVMNDPRPDPSAGASGTVRPPAGRDAGAITPGPTLGPGRQQQDAGRRDRETAGSAHAGRRGRPAAQAGRQAGRVVHPHPAATAPRRQDRRRTAPASRPAVGPKARQRPQKRRRDWLSDPSGTAFSDRAGACPGLSCAPPPPRFPGT